MRSKEYQLSTSKRANVILDDPNLRHCDLKAIPGAGDLSPAKRVCVCVYFSTEIKFHFVVTHAHPASSSGREGRAHGNIIRKQV